MTALRDDDLLRLRHMRDYGRQAMMFVQDAERDDLDTDLLLHHAVSYALGIIGEAATHLSDGFRDAHPEIPWRQIIGMRNFLFHDYAGVDDSILWDTATLEVPRLLELLKDILPDTD
jgi:uncharacterized protein with HEPN domain